MKPAMTQNNGGRFVDTRLHRPCIVDDEACAPEGVVVHLDVYDYNRNTTQEEQKAFDPGPPPRISVPDWAVWIILGASIMGTLLIIHFGVQA